MLWIITEDRVEDGKYVGACNDDLMTSVDCVRLDKQQIARIGAECTDEFRLLDGDDNLLFRGVCKDLDDQDGDSAFEPLDWAEGAGAATMEYRKIGETVWKIL